MEPCIRCGIGNESDNSGQTVQGLPAPIFADEGKHTMFNFVPLPRTRRKMTDMESHLQCVGESWEFDLPQARPIPIASPAISCKKQFVGMRIALASHVGPPPPDTFHRKLGGVMAQANIDPALIAR